MWTGESKQLKRGILLIESLEILEKWRILWCLIKRQWNVISAWVRKFHSLAQWTASIAHAVPTAMIQ